MKILCWYILTIKYGSWLRKGILHPPSSFKDFKSNSEDEVDGNEMKRDSSNGNMMPCFAS